MSTPSVTAMAADTPFDPCGKLIALGVDKRVSNIPLSTRAECAAEWIAGTVVAADGRAVHADYWERHPEGDETLYLLEGRVAITLAQHGTAERHLNLEAGQAFIVPKGVWHRLDVLEPCRLFFISSPKGTEHRPVDLEGPPLFAAL